MLANVGLIASWNDISYILFVLLHKTQISLCVTSFYGHSSAASLTSCPGLFKHLGFPCENGLGHYKGVGERSS